MLESYSNEVLLSVTLRILPAYMGCVNESAFPGVLESFEARY